LTAALLRHPRRVLAGALVCVAILGILGWQVENRLGTISSVMPGSQAARAEALSKQYFGDSAPFSILLRGPADELDRQGPLLVRALHDEYSASTLSPWDRGAVGDLRPSPESALILADFHVDEEVAAKRTVPELRQILQTHISAPVTAVTSGYASILTGFKDGTERAAKQAEYVAIPVLLIVLLLIFRSPIAACIPIVFGIVTVVSCRGVIALLSRWMHIDPLAIPVSSMMGLALGVDYALLMVSRFREELSLGTGSAEAADLTRRTAGRTVATAGATLLCAVFVAFLIVPGPQFTSLFGAVIIVTALSVLIAWAVGPAVLTLLGGNVNRWQLGSGAPREGGGWAGQIGKFLTRPGLVALVIAVAMLIPAAVVLGIKIGPVGVSGLPKDSEARRNADTISHAVGPGWSSPFMLVVATEHGAITDHGRFGPVERWERRLSNDPRINVVFGPARVVRHARRLQRSGDDLFVRDRSNPASRLHLLGLGLGRATDGVSQLRGGLQQASLGAGLLGEGSERATTGAAAVSHGVHKVATGNQRATDAIGRLDAGAQRLAKGQQSARFGSLELKLGLEDLAPNVGRKGLGAARSLRANLERAAIDQPELEDEAAEAAALVTRLRRAKSEVGRLRRTAAKEHTGLTKLASGGVKLQEGTHRLLGASQKATNGLTSLDRGSQQLAGGISRLSGGARSLEGKLAEGFHRSYPLQSGLRKSSTGVLAQGRGVGKNIDRLHTSSPGLFDSGHFVLSALAGAPHAEREDVNQVVGLKTGGQGVRLIVVPKNAPNTPGSLALYDRLQEEGADVARASGTSVGVSGGVPQQADYTRITLGRFPLVALGISLATFLILVLFTRALLLPAIAVILNLGTVAVAFGILVALGYIPSEIPFSNSGSLSVVTVIAVFCLAFALSIDYAVFLTMRMREHYLRHGDHAQAVFFGLEKTARVITGAAAIMGAVFLTYAAAPFEFLSQIGTGLTIAVFLDATIVRIVLLPALMLVFGDRVWWLPASLERTLPHLDPHGPEPAEAGTY
jgi:RND superfamily putative drug exporter